MIEVTDVLDGVLREGERLEHDRVRAVAVDQTPAVFPVLAWTVDEWL